MSEEREPLVSENLFKNVIAILRENMHRYVDEVLNTTLEQTIASAKAVKKLRKEQS